MLVRYCAVEMSAVIVNLGLSLCLSCPDSTNLGMPFVHRRRIV